MQNQKGGLLGSSTASLCPPYLQAHCRRLATGHLPAAAAQKAAAEEESGASDVASTMARQTSGSNPGSPAMNGNAAAAIAAAAAAVERAVNGTGERGGRSQQLQPIRCLQTLQHPLNKRCMHCTSPRSSIQEKAAVMLSILLGGRPDNG